MFFCWWFELKILSELNCNLDSVLDKYIIVLLFIRDFFFYKSAMNFIFILCRITYWVNLKEYNVINEDYIKNLKIIKTDRLREAGNGSAEVIKFIFDGYNTFILWLTSK